MNVLEILKWHDYCKKFDLTINELLYLAAIKADKKDVIRDNTVIKSLIDKKFLTESLTLTTKKSPFNVKGVDDVDLTKFLLETFPRVIIPTSGKPARSPENEVNTKVRWFLKTYDYPEDVIRKAIELYIEYYQGRNFEYMQTASFFVKKQDRDRVDNSSLAEWCERVLIEGTEIKTFDIDL